MKSHAREAYLRRIATGQITHGFTQEEQIEANAMAEEFGW